MKLRRGISLLSFIFAVAISPASNAQSVIDLDADASINSRVSGVLDFDKPQPPPTVQTTTDGLASSTAAAPVAAPLPTAEIDAMILEAATRYAGHPGIRRAGLSSQQWIALFRANITVESAFDPTAVSHAGAIGLGQLMPDTARVLGVDPNVPSQNLDGSARYLLAQLQRFGSAELALAAYNAGPEAVQQYSGIPPYRETQGHVRKVMTIFNQTTGENT